LQYSRLTRRRSGRDDLQVFTFALHRTWPIRDYPASIIDRSIHLCRFTAAPCARSSHARAHMLLWCQRRRCPRQLTAVAPPPLPQDTRAAAEAHAQPLMTRVAAALQSPSAPATTPVPKRVNPCLGRSEPCLGRIDKDKAVVVHKKPDPKKRRKGILDPPKMGVIDYIDSWHGRY